MSRDDFDGARVRIAEDHRNLVVAYQMTDTTHRAAPTDQLGCPLPCVRLVEVLCHDRPLQVDPCCTPLLVEDELSRPERGMRTSVTPPTIGEGQRS